MGDTFGEIVEQLRRSTVQVKVHQHGGGSGVIWSQDGRIVTNSHVVGDAVEDARDSGNLEVELWDGRRLPAKLVNRDRRRDLAALHVEASGLPAATSGDSHALRAGELVVAVGNPFGFTGAASTGVVHHVTSLEGALGPFANRSWVVSQLRLAPGNSGGPLANARGEVVGINTMIAGGLAFAIPSQSVAQFLNAPAGERGGLGVVVRPVLLVERAGRRPGRALGLIVLEVISHSPAHHASILQGDVLVGAAGKRFQSAYDLEAAIEAHGDGNLELQFRRGANENIRTVAARLAPASVRAA